MIKVGINMFENYSAICFAVDKCNGIRGRKKFHKIFYLSKEAGIPLPEHFQWNSYGPFSYELASEIDTLRKINLLEEKNIGNEFCYYITDKGKSFLSESVSDEDEKYTQFNMILKKLNPHNGNDLEKISSIRYMYKHHFNRTYILTFLNYTKKYTPEEIDEGEKLLFSLFPQFTED